MNDVKYTQVAAKAVSLAELFDARFEQGLQGPVQFRVELSAPDGPSTAGGKQALQHIKLVPSISGPAIVIGSASTARQTAEIRTYEHIAGLYAQRFKGARIPVDVTKYQELSQQLASFFRAMKLTVTFADAGGIAPGPVAAAPSTAGRTAFAAFVGLLVGLILVALGYWLLFRRH